MESQNGEAVAAGLLAAEAYLANCLVLIGGDGLPVVDEQPDGELRDGDAAQTLGGVLLAETGDSDAAGSDFLVFIPHFTPGRLRPLRPGPFERAERQPES